MSNAENGPKVGSSPLARTIILFQATGTLAQDSRTGQAVLDNHTCLFGFTPDPAGTCCKTFNQTTFS
jgi:hypothetical protein